MTLLLLDFSPSLSPGVEAPEELPVLSGISTPDITDSELSKSLALLRLAFVVSSLLEFRIPTNAE